MKPKKIWANLSVKDLEQTHEFYKKMGFKPNGAFSKENELVSFLVGEDDFVVHFFSEESSMFNASLGGEIADLKKGNKVMFTLSADNKEEVDEWAEEVKKQAAPYSASHRKSMTNSKITLPEIVSREEWREERKELLKKEKKLTKMRDAVSSERRQLPMVKIERDYPFEGPEGEVSLLDLFDGRPQLIIYHFMFDPQWEKSEV